MNISFQMKILRTIFEDIIDALSLLMKCKETIGNSGSSLPYLYNTNTELQYGIKSEYQRNHLRSSTKTILI